MSGCVMDVLAAESGIKSQVLEQIYELAKKYELEYQAKKMEKKIQNIKEKIIKIKNLPLNNT